MTSKLDIISKFEARNSKQTSNDKNSKFKTKKNESTTNCFYSVFLIFVFVIRKFEFRACFVFLSEA